MKRSWAFAEIIKDAGRATHEEVQHRRSVISLLKAREESKSKCTSGIPLKTFSSLFPVWRVSEILSVTPLDIDLFAWKVLKGIRQTRQCRLLVLLDSDYKTPFVYSAVSAANASTLPPDIPPGRHRSPDCYPETNQCN